MTLKDLERFICPSSGSSIGVLVQVQFDEDNAYKGVKGLSLSFR